MISFWTWIAVAFASGILFSLALLLAVWGAFNAVSPPARRLADYIRWPNIAPLEDGMAGGPRTTVWTARERGEFIRTGGRPSSRMAAVHHLPRKSINGKRTENY